MVTSRGGAAVGFQLGAWGGHGKPPFRAAIMQSGSSNSQPSETSCFLYGPRN